MIDPVALWRAGLKQDQRPAVCACGTQLGAAKFCPQCGTAAPQRDVEWRCQGGHWCHPAARFCPECGDARVKAPVAGAGAAVEIAAQVQEETSQERAERERLHAEAVRLGRADPAITYQAPTGRYPVKLIHFLTDGLSFAGLVWMRGQELAIEQDPASARWQQAERWINLDRWQQIEVYGEHKFAEGPWPGRRYEDGAGQFQQLRAVTSSKPDDPRVVTGPSAELLREADRRERMRRRGVPAPALR